MVIVGYKQAVYI